MVERLEAISYVCLPDAMPPIDVPAGLAALVENSVAQQEECTDGETRYRMLQTIREFGLEQVAEAGEMHGLQRRHAMFCRDLARQAEPHFTNSDRARWLRRIDEELEDIRMALRWCVDQPEVVVGLDLGGALWRYWCARGIAAEGSQWLQRLLDLIEPKAVQMPAPVMACALLGAGVTAYHCRQAARARELTEGALVMYRDLQDSDGIESALNNLANVAHDLNHDLERAAALYRDSLALARTGGHQRSIALSLLNLAGVLLDQGAVEAAEDLFVELLAMRDAVPDRSLVAKALFCRAFLAVRAGDISARVDALYSESESLWEQLEQHNDVVEVRLARGDLAIRQGDYGRATSLIEECVAMEKTLPAHKRNERTPLLLGHLARSSGDLAAACRFYADAITSARSWDRTSTISAGIEAIAAIAHARGHVERAARLLGAAAALSEADCTCRALDSPGHEEVLGAVQAALGEERFAAMWSSGRTLTLHRLARQPSMKCSCRLSWR